MCHYSQFELIAERYTMRVACSRWKRGLATLKQGISRCWIYNSGIDSWYCSAYAIELENVAFLNDFMNHHQLARGFQCGISML